MTDVQIKEGMAFFKCTPLQSKVDIVDVDSVQEGAITYVALKTVHGGCIVQRIDSNGQADWTTEGKYKIYDVDVHQRDDYTYKIDLLDNAYDDSCLIIYALTYVFYISKTNGELVGTEYNR